MKLRAVRVCRRDCFSNQHRVVSSLILATSPLKFSTLDIQLLTTEASRITHSTPRVILRSAADCPIFAKFCTQGVKIFKLRKSKMTDPS